MAIYAWPITLRPSNATFWLEANTLRMESPLSRAAQTLIRPGARWVCRMDFNRRGHGVAPRLDALVAMLDGGAHEVALFDWRRPVPRGAAASTTTVDTFLSGDTFTDGGGFVSYASSPVMASAATRGAETLYTSGWENSAAVLLAGDYVGLNGRLYMVLEDVTSSGAGLATLRIRPRLHAGAAAGARPTLIRPTTRFRLAAQGVENPTEAGPLSSYSMTFVESLP